MMGVADFVRIERREQAHGEPVTLRVDRGPMNALSRRLLRELRDAVHQLSADPGVPAVVLYGGPLNFSSGLDPRDFAGADTEPGDLRLVSEAFDAVAGLEVPVVAAITGYALRGGLELAMRADFRVCGDNARLARSERHLGGVEALDNGWVEQLVGADEVYATAVEVARSLARRRTLVAQGR